MRITIDENDNITVELDNGHVQTFPEGWQEDCVKAAIQREKAAGWEKRCEELLLRIEEETDRAEAWELRCEELEQELRDAQERLDEAAGKKARVELEADQLRHRAEEMKTALDKQVDCNEQIIAARDELRKQREALMKRIGEMEQELRDAQERIHDQDLLIAKYDDENKKLKAELDCERNSNKYWKMYAESRDILLKKAQDLKLSADRHPLLEWARVIHDNAVEHGWWDEERSFGDIVALCHSELSEALEEYRNGKPMCYEGENGKPEGIAVEMIDCIIRILDWCGKEGIDVDGLLAKKHEYNEGRPFRHGGKKL